MNLKDFLNLACVNQVFEYINYHWKAKGRHGIHSPFIYEMLDQCFKTPIKNQDYIRINDRYTSLLHDERKIKIEDHGAGSKFLKKHRSIKSIAKLSSSKGKYGRLLYRLSNYYQPKQILELGTSLGIGTHYLALGNKNAKVTTVEGCSATYSIANEDLPENVHSVNATFDKFIDQLDTSEQFDLIFVDGHHNGQALLRYLERLAPFIHNNTIILLDDIRWSKSMLKAWKNLINSSNYHVTIDLFRIGIILQRNQQEKEHFIIRF